VRARQSWVNYEFENGAGECGGSLRRRSRRGRELVVLLGRIICGLDQRSLIVNGDANGSFRELQSDKHRGRLGRVGDLEDLSYIPGHGASADASATLDSSPTKTARPDRPCRSSD
jgi:hypothetical protein